MPDVQCPYFYHDSHGCWWKGEYEGCFYPKNYKNCPLLDENFVKKFCEARQKGEIYDYQNAP